jgi:hypothetical protein
MCGTIRRPMKGKARFESQLKLYNIMAVQTAIYGSEAWIMRKNLETRKHTAEMEFLLGVVGYMGTDHHRNTEIRKILKSCSGNIKIQNYINNWLLLL